MKEVPVRGPHQGQCGLGVVPACIQAHDLAPPAPLRPPSDRDENLPGRPTWNPGHGRGVSPIPSLALPTPALWGHTLSESWGPAHPLPSQGWDPLLPLRPPASPSSPSRLLPSCLLPEAPGLVRAALSGHRGGGSPVSPPCPPGAHSAWHSGARSGCPQHLFRGRGFTELPEVRPDFSGRRGLLAPQRSLKTWVWGRPVTASAAWGPGPSPCSVLTWPVGPGQPLPQGPACTGWHGAGSHPAGHPWKGLPPSPWRREGQAEARAAHTMTQREAGLPCAGLAVPGPPAAA